MKRLFLVFIILVGVFGIYNLWIEEKFYFKVFSFIFIPLLLTFYVVYRTSLWNKFDYLLILCLLFAYLTDVLNVIEFETILKIQIQIAFVFIYQLLYIIIFRKEGAFLVHNSFYDSIKIFGPALIVFILFGYFLDESSDLSYFLLFICSIQIVFFTVLALFRPAKATSYALVSIGASFIFSSDILYVFYFFVSQKLSIYLFSYTFYVIAQVLLVYGLMLNFNDGISKKIISLSIFESKNDKIS
jgi:hypothetical protein